MRLSRAWHGALALVATANLLLQLVLTATATDDTLGVPHVWLAYTLVRGAFVHEYPYPFVDRRPPPSGGAGPSLTRWVAGCGIRAVGAVDLALSSRECQHGGGGAG